MGALFSGLAGIAVVLAGLALLYVAFLVAVVRFSAPMPAEMEVVSIQPTQVEHETRVAMDPDVRGLLATGFEWRGWLAVPQARAVAAVLVDAAAGDVASVLTMQGMRYVDVTRQSRAGRRVTTVNAGIVSFYLPHPASHTARFPHVTDVAHLVRLHRAVVRAEALRPPFDVPSVGREAGWMARGTATANREQVQTGLFREEGGMLHRTWRAAARGVWLLSPQTAGWHRRRQEAQARAAEAMLLRTG